ncbi:hypothetical protein [Nocardia cyriacigeorgica]|jgi:hypothetical protein|uniref:hypothetical protein n=1 Tax=Nocardia cyriacigeorgica TaxID=135487 RepID=UPI0013D79233|nr:hypothetical protein [Nocardia cyriacigeorgica]MBF6436440.1 hypothetical protein [Nocardia cyriacigeorgica]MBF6452009.1 hypothetical protein [Nocardia cyriacigeorgica]MBF6478373.1 hypothetical protein [Nocardia cyriacigeorgica]MBF6549178.1 hypothetical protein [Nocardia cyriacigeorgica]NEW25405.1 hypothetical protein [Nocardia cyriacigeorgica]
MASGDGSENGEVSGGSSNSEAPDPSPAREHRADPVVETVWLSRRRAQPRHPGRPRLSTIALTLLFIALLMLYVVLRPN